MKYSERSMELVGPQTHIICLQMLMGRKKNNEYSLSQIEVTNGLNLNQCGRNHKVIKAIQCVRGRGGT